MTAGVPGHALGGAPGLSGEGRAPLRVGPFFRRSIGIGGSLRRKQDRERPPPAVRLGCAPAEAILIGDTLHDWEVAVELGIDCALVPGRHCAREQLESCGGTLLSSLRDLNSLVTGVGVDRGEGNRRGSGRTRLHGRDFQ